jgi:hypothetical protein
VIAYKYVNSIVDEKGSRVLKPMFDKQGVYDVTYAEGETVYAPVIDGVKTMFFIFNDINLARRFGAQHAPLFKRSTKELWKIECNVMQPATHMLNPGMVEHAIDYHTRDDVVADFWRALYSDSITEFITRTSMNLVRPPNGTFYTPYLKLAKRVERLTNSRLGI